MDAKFWGALGRCRCGGGGVASGLFFRLEGGGSDSATKNFGFFTLRPYFVLPIEV